MTSQKVRFAIVGLGHIAQNAVLPAFKHCGGKCEVTAIISDSPQKIAELSKVYGVSRSWSYDKFDDALNSDCFDAIYIALPNEMHKEFAIRAAKSGKHVLTEKPMALAEADCLLMIEAAEKSNVKLMVAYRLHFEKMNLMAVEAIKQGKIGAPRLFNSSFSMQVRDGNIRTQQIHGGGPLNDIGIYCINAARYLFDDEPIEVLAMTGKSRDHRFSEIEESVGGLLKFPGEKVASFVCSFGASDCARYEVIGSEGRIVLDPAYDYAKEIEYELIAGSWNEHHKSGLRDQFAPELLHFAECILEGKQPGPSGYEGLSDLRVIEALRRSAQTGMLIKLEPAAGESKPDHSLVHEKSAVRTPLVSNPPLVNVEAPGK